MRINRTIAAAVILIMVAMVPRASAQTNATLTPTPYQTALNSSGAPIVGACVWTYTAGTSTPSATFTAKDGAVSNSNPIIADSAGQFVAYLIPGQSYKFVYETACTPPAHGSVLRTQDGIDSVFNLNGFIAGVVGDEALTVRNTLAGVANRGVVFVGNDTSATLGTLAAHSSTFTTSGAAIANGVKLTSSGAGGLSLQASDAAGIVHFFTGTGTVERGQITAAGVWNWSAFGAHQFTAGAAGVNSIGIKNSSAGTGNSGQLVVASDTVISSLVATASTFTPSGVFAQASTTLFGDGAGGMALSANHASGAMRLYTGGGVLRWGVNAAGDVTIGASSHILDSVGVPTWQAGCDIAAPTATIIGTDYAFNISSAGGSNTANCTLLFGHAWSTAPICVFNSSIYTGEAATTTAAITLTKVASTAPTTATVICRGY